MYNMVSKLGLVGGVELESSLCNLLPICLFESPWTFDLFDSPSASMWPQVRKGVKKHDIHIKHKSYKLELLGEMVV